MIIQHIESTLFQKAYCLGLVTKCGQLTDKGKETFKADTCEWIKRREKTMIFGNEKMIHVDGAEYIRASELGRLHKIAEEFGMDKNNSCILADALQALHDRLKEEVYKEVKERIPQ